MSPAQREQEEDRLRRRRQPLSTSSTPGNAHYRLPILKLPTLSPLSFSSKRIVRVRSTTAGIGDISEIIHNKVFFGNIVGVKGPKCGKEVERLEGWIKHFMNGGEKGKKREPLKLAHLLLGKAILLSEDGNGLAGLGFPSTIEEFLQKDPPKD